MRYMPQKGLHVFHQRRQRKNRERERGGRSNDGTQRKQDDMFLASSVGPYQHTGIVGHLHRIEEAVGG